MSQLVKTYPSIAPEVYLHYNTRYNNYTYRLFESKLLKLTAESQRSGGHAFRHTVLNLLLYGIKTEVKDDVGKRCESAKLVLSGRRFS